MSITLKSNVECVSCGTTAMRLASSRRVSCSSGCPPIQHAAGERRQNAGDDAQQRRLARAVRTEKADDRPAFHFERHAIEYVGVRLEPDRAVRSGWPDRASCDARTRTKCQRPSASSTIAFIAQGINEWVGTRRRASASRDRRGMNIGLLPASHAPKKGRPRWPGFLTRGSLRRVGLPGRLRLQCRPQA